MEVKSIKIEKQYDNCYDLYLGYGLYVDNNRVLIPYKVICLYLLTLMVNGPCPPTIIMRDKGAQAEL